MWFICGCYTYNFHLEQIMLIIFIWKLHILHKTCISIDSYTHINIYIFVMILVIYLLHTKEFFLHYFDDMPVLWVVAITRRSDIRTKIILHTIFYTFCMNAQCTCSEVTLPIPRLFFVPPFFFYLHCLFIKNLY
jgi:hypothetical protein